MCVDKVLGGARVKELESLSFDNQRSSARCASQNEANEANGPTVFDGVLRQAAEPVRRCHQTICAEVLPSPC
jgi:hypothetical protein